METPQPLLTTDDLAITYLPGSGPDLVVAFTGIGALDGPHQKEEFIRVAGMEGANHVAFVKDRLRSWFSAAGMQDRIIAAVLALRQKLGLSAKDMGTLLGASGLSVYKWESGKVKPRAKQLPAIAALRGIGKKEALARLESIAAMAPTTGRAAGKRTKRSAK